MIYEGRTFYLANYELRPPALLSLFHLKTMMSYVSYCSEQRKTELVCSNLWRRRDPRSKDNVMKHKRKQSSNLQCERFQKAEAEQQNKSGTQRKADKQAGQSKWKMFYFCFLVLLSCFASEAWTDLETHELGCGLNTPKEKNWDVTSQCRLLRKIKHRNRRRRM